MMPKNLCLIGAALALLPYGWSITPEQMLGAPRRSVALPNPTGAGQWLTDLLQPQDLAVFSQTNYSWETHKTSRQWNLMDLRTGDISLLFKGSDVEQITWVGPTNTSILYLNDTNEEIDGGVELWISDVQTPNLKYRAASLPAPFSGLKAVTTSSGDINFLLHCQMYPNGTAYNEDLVKKPLSTARIYDSIYPRWFDEWLTNTTFAVFAGTLTGGDSQYSLRGELRNLMNGVEGVETMLQIGGGMEDYDLTPDGLTVAYLMSDPKLSRSNTSTSYIYLVPHDGSRTASPINSRNDDATPRNARGASQAPRFSPDGLNIAYLQRDGESRSGDKYRIYTTALDNVNITTRARNWDRSPTELKWAADGQSLFVEAPDLARERIFEVPMDAADDYVPLHVTGEGSVSAFYVMPMNALLVSSTTLWSSRDIYTVTGKTTSVGNWTGTTNMTTSSTRNTTRDARVLFAANEVDSELSGLGPEDVEEFWYDGNFTKIHGWIIKPEDFQENRTYPLAFLIHGGPQGSWSNDWSTRWNPKVWADQGYIVAAIDPTGSEGYGQTFVEGVINQWGGTPYDDLTKGWDYINRTYPYVDTKNGIAAGASYGGYMVNWIQGHDLGRRFKALVTHSGTTSTLSKYYTDGLQFIQYNFNGTLWDDRANYEQWDPLRHVLKWQTPHFVSHSTLDYRIPESDGITLFNILQERGVPSRFLSFPDEGHWVSNRENGLVWHREVFKWINYYSGISHTL